MLKGFLRAAALNAAQKGEGNTARTELEAILLGKFTSEAKNGRTVVGVTEGGGTTSYTLPTMLTPAEVMAFAEEGLELLEEQTGDQDTPDLTRNRRVTRLRASFYRAQV